MNTTNIKEFFKYLQELNNNVHITQVETKPIKIKKDIYISGFRKNGITTIEAHIKHIEQILLKTNDYTMEMPLKDNPNEEMWLDIELMDKTIIDKTFNELKNHFIQLKGYTIAQIEYIPKTQPNQLCTIEENIIYEDKRIACKETINKRKLSTKFRSHFIHWE